MTEADVMRDTLRHVRLVQEELHGVVAELLARAVNHDASKFGPAEWPLFVLATPQLAGTAFGSEAYRAGVELLKPALQHHYRENRHHPEHFACGLDGMTLLDLVELLCDWRAAQQRHEPPGSFERSFAVQVPRLKIGTQLETILRNTVRERGWS